MELPPRYHLIKRLRNFLSAEWQRRTSAQARYNWPLQGRPEQQVPEGNWRAWLILAGRGFGKTRTGAETIRRWVQAGIYKRIALIADTESEGRDVMIEGVSGLLDVHPPKEKPIFEPSKRRITWPNGAVATLFSAENPEQLRGPQFDCAWIDELAKFRCMQEVWDQINFSLRLGQNPRMIITTTPRPCKLLNHLLAGQDKWVHITEGTTFDNAGNLSPQFLEEMKTRYGQSRLGAQELMGKILNDQAGALWTHDIIEENRRPCPEDLKRVIVAIDPAVTSHGESDETGMIVAALDLDNHVYILDDLSGRMPPRQWANRAIEAYHRYQADSIIAEVNQGGDLVASMLKTIDPEIPFKGVHATRGKIVRAEPVANLYYQKRIHHIPSGKLSLLEEQMCSYTPESSRKSPDRLDAVVWAVTELLLQRPDPDFRMWGV